MSPSTTDWMPDITGRTGPRYRAIVDALAEAIQTGALRPGDRLPTHRDMAWHLHVNVSTVTEAYREAARRQLVAGEVGRGTYVRAGSLEAGLFALAESAARAPIDLSTNVPAEPGSEAGLESTLAAMQADGSLGRALAYPTFALLERARAAAGTMLSSRGVAAADHACQIVAGAQQALLAVLMSLVGPGNKVLVEELTFPGIKAVARELAITLVPVAMDEDGLDPDALAREACRSGARTAVLVPNLHNPTTATMTPERRRALISVAERLGLTLIEDDVYGGLANERPLLAEDTDRVLLVSSLSKTAAPGLRFGWIAGPPHLIEGLTPEAHATYWPMSPIALSLACRMVEDGTVAALTDWQRREVVARHKLCSGVLGTCVPAPRPAPHFWLPLGDGERTAKRAEALGVSVVPGSTFAVGRIRHDGVRICLTAPATRTVLREGLGTLMKAMGD